MREEPGVKDMCIFEAPEDEGVYIADLDLDKLRKHRSRDVNGDKYRHPEKYKLLTE